MLCSCGGQLIEKQKMIKDTKSVPYLYCLNCEDELYPISSQIEISKVSM